ncbi:MAG: hypothetical protein ACREBG_23660 [Pyrinomonadaceae bacterium]
MSRRDAMTLISIQPNHEFQFHSFVALPGNERPIANELLGLMPNQCLKLTTGEQWLERFIEAIRTERVSEFRREIAKSGCTSLGRV